MFPTVWLAGCKEMPQANTMNSISVLQPSTTSDFYLWQETVWSTIVDNVWEAGVASISFFSFVFPKNGNKTTWTQRKQEQQGSMDQWGIFMLTVLIGTLAGSSLISKSNPLLKSMLTIPIKSQLHKSLMMANAQNPFRQFPQHADDFHWHNNSK